MSKPSTQVYNVASDVEDLSYIHTIEYASGLADFLGMEVSVVSEALANHACSVTTRYHAKDGD